MPAFQYGFKLNNEGQIVFQPILKRPQSSNTNNQAPQVPGYYPYGQAGQTDQFSMGNFAYGAPPTNLSYTGFNALPNTGGFNTGFPAPVQQGFDPFAGVNPTLLGALNGPGAPGYGNTGFPQQTGGGFGGGYSNIPGPAMFGSPTQLTNQNSATYSNLLSSMPGSLGALQGLDLPGVFGSGNLTNAVAQQGYSIDGGSPFMQTAAQPSNPSWMYQSNAGQFGYLQQPTSPYGYQTTMGTSYGAPQTQYGRGAFAQNYQSPLNSVQYPMTQTAQGYYGEPSQAFGYQPSPFVRGGYQPPPVGYTQYAKAQPYYEQAGAFGQQGFFPQTQNYQSAASVGGFANTPLGQASQAGGFANTPLGQAGGFADLGKIGDLVTKADKNLAAAGKITELLDNNQLTASLKGTTKSLIDQLDEYKNMDFNTIQNFDLSSFLRG